MRRARRAQSVLSPPEGGVRQRCSHRLQEVAFSGSAEMVDRARPLPGLRVGDTECQRDRSRGRQRRIRAHQDAQFVALIGTDRDHRHRSARHRIPDDLEIDIGEALYGQHEAAPLERLVQDANGETITQLSVGQPHEYGIAIMNDADALALAGCQGVGHHYGDDRDDARIEHRAHTHDMVEFRLTLLPPFDVEIGVVGDEPRRTVDLGHDRIAGIDAEPALDTAQVRPVPNIDPGGTDVDALIAIDAVAGRHALRPQRCALLHRTARLTAIVAVGHVERVLVGERRLNARPWAHVKTDLFAQVARKRIGREREDADPDIGDERRFEYRQFLYQRRGIGEVEHPRAAGPPSEHQPQEVLEATAPDSFDCPRLPVALQVLATISLDPALDRLEQVGPYRLRTQITEPYAPGDRVHQEQGHCRQDEEPGEIVNLLRPELDEEEVEAP